MGNMRLSEVEILSLSLTPINLKASIRCISLLWLAFQTQVPWEFVLCIGAPIPSENDFLLYSCSSLYTYSYLLININNIRLENIQSFHKSLNVFPDSNSACFLSVIIIQAINTFYLNKRGRSFALNTS